MLLLFEVEVDGRTAGEGDPSTARVSGIDRAEGGVSIDLALLKGCPGSEWKLSGWSKPVMYGPVKKFHNKKTGQG